jgi:hypothetical protein
MKMRFFFFLLAVVLSMLACQATSPADSQEPTQPEGVLFQDDFADPDSGWDQVTAADGVTDYADGIYRIFINNANTDVWANPDLNFGDVRVEVDATKVAGDDNNDFGVVCRYQDAENFYFFVISSDGYYGIGKVVEGAQTLIGNELMQPSEDINQGDSSNRVGAECAGSALRIYANDQLLLETEDTSFTSGDVGLIAGSFDNPGVDIHFDNFVVSQP